MYTNEQLQGGFTVGDWVILPGKNQLHLTNDPDAAQEPENKVFEVLMALARRDGDLVSNDELIDEVWDGRAFGNAVIERCIRLLRVHFNDEKPFKYIGNVPRKGYRLLKPVELIGQVDEQKEEPADPKGGYTRLWKIVTAAVTIGFLAIAAYVWTSSGPPAGKPPAVRSLAILPFENLSDDPANAYIAAGIKTVLGQRLAELSEFTIKNIRDQHRGEPAEIAASLDVESVLYGSVQALKGDLRVVYEIVRGSDGVTMLAGSESGQIGDLFALQERLANAVRDELAGPKTPQLITRREPDSAAYNSYMRGLYELELRFDGDNLENAIDLFNESIRLDEKYGPAYLGLATAYALMPDYRGEPLDEGRDRALQTIATGVSQDPEISVQAGAIHGFVYQQQKRWLESEAAFQRAIGASVVDSNAFTWYSRMLACVGRLEDARDVALMAEVIDPDNAVVNSRIAMSFTWLENEAKAREYFDRANELGATGEIHVIVEALLLLSEGRAEQSMSLTYDAVELSENATEWIEPVFRALDDRMYADEALAAVNRAWADREIIPHIVLFVRTFLGDLDGAMEIARLLEEEGEAFSMEIIFAPQLLALRQHPGFYSLLENLGIVDYWDEHGCTWDGDRAHCPAG